MFLSVACSSFCEMTNGKKEARKRMKERRDMENFYFNAYIPVYHFTDPQLKCYVTVDGTH